MGCWNTTCGISNLPIFCGEEVVVFLLVESRFANTFVEVDSYFTPCLVPFYGQYNDYGGVEECHGAGLPVILKAFAEKLTELPEGENSCHDIATSRKGLTIEQVLELDHENRLFINGTFKLGDKNNHDSARAPKNWGQKVVHMQIKKSIFDYILDNWELTDYMNMSNSSIVTRKAGSISDWSETHYLKYRFADLVTHLPTLEGIKQPSTGLIQNFSNADRHNPAFDYLYERLKNPLLAVNEIDLDLYVEALKGGFINRFMLATRKAWIKPIGNGCQHTDQEPYRLLLDGMIKVLNTEKQERE